MKPLMRQAARALAMVVLGGLWGARALNAHAEPEGPQYLASPSLYADGDRVETTCEYRSFGTFTQLVCERRELAPCDRGSASDTEIGEDDPRTQLVRRGCQRPGTGVTGLQPGEILVVRGGRSEVVGTRN